MEGKGVGEDRREGRMYNGRSDDVEGKSLKGEREVEVKGRTRG